MTACAQPHPLVSELVCARLAGHDGLHGFGPEHTTTSTETKDTDPMSELPANATTWTTRHTDRAQWGPGPWDNEPDKVSWTDAATGRPCLIHRGPSGALCGYVAVDPRHPLHGADYGTAEDTCGVEVHGGLTYADSCADVEDESTGICHVPEPGRPADVWWFGFDCAHGGDVAPAHRSAFRRAGIDESPYEWLAVYRDVGYVVAEVQRLARQLCTPETDDPR